MHECPSCHMACDCDGEDHEQAAPPDCRHNCDDEMPEELDVDGEAEEVVPAQGVVCPFCNEEGFDLVGLKHHLETGRCVTYCSTETIMQERQRLERERATPEAT